MSEPGGRGRASVRVHFADRTVIATFRMDRERGQAEAQLLRGLSAVGAPVPEYLGKVDGIVFQQDVGPRRLSAEIARLEPSDRDALALRAFESLQILGSQTAALQEMLMDIAVNSDWIRNFVGGPNSLPRALGLAPPKFDGSSLAACLSGGGLNFVKWDARSGNAAVQNDGRVVWFDWEHYGQRRGPEPFGFLLGDEFWPIGPEKSLELLATLTGAQIDKAFLIQFTTLQIVQRLILINDRLTHVG